MNDMISYPHMIKMYQEFVVVETSFQGRFCWKKSSEICGPMAACFFLEDPKY